MLRYPEDDLSDYDIDFMECAEDLNLNVKQNARQEQDQSNVDT